MIVAMTINVRGRKAKRPVSPMMMMVYVMCRVACEDGRRVMVEDEVRGVMVCVVMVVFCE